MSSAGSVTTSYGAIRNRKDLADAGGLDLLIECSAEPSVQARLAGDDRYLINTDLTGTINRRDHARRHGAAIVFLSTSGVYPIAPLPGLPLVATQTQLRRRISGPCNSSSRWRSEPWAILRPRLSGASLAQFFLYGGVTLVGAILCGSGSLLPGRQQAHDPE